MENPLNFWAMGWKKKVLKSEGFLKEMNAVVAWKPLVALIEPHDADGRLGRKPFLVEWMLRIYCLQHWFHLSDPAVEEAIYDRKSFQRFLSLDIDEPHAQRQPGAFRDESQRGGWTRPAGWCTAWRQQPPRCMTAK